MDANRKYTSSNLLKYRVKGWLAKTLLGDFSEAIAGLVRETGHVRILSLGCGEGFGIKSHLLGHGIPFRECTGLDISIGALTLAKTLLQDERIKLVCGDVYDMPVKMQMFDTIMCLEVLEHLSKPEIPLRKIAESFKGHCIFSVPREPVYRIMRMVILRRDLRRFGNHPEHLQNWTRRQFESLIAQFFDIDRVLMPFPWTVVLCHTKKGR